MKRAVSILLGLTLLLSLCACGGKPSASSDQPNGQPADAAAVWQENYDAGFSAMLAGNYSEAVGYFQAAVDADPTLDVSYIALAHSTALATKDINQVISILQKGLSAAARTNLIISELHNYASNYASSGSLDSLDITLDKYKYNRASLEEYSYDARNNTWYLDITFESTSDGKAIRGTAYNRQDGSVDGYITDWIYDGADFTGYTVRDPDGAILLRREFTRDSDGNILLRKEFNSDGSSTITETDKWGKTLSRVEYDTQGVVTEHYVNEYNEKGYLATETKYDSQGAVISRRTNEYDENGELAAYYLTDGQGNTTAWLKVFNENGRTGIEFYDSTRPDHPYGKIYD